MEKIKVTLPIRKKGGSERGELLLYFSQKTGMTIPRLAKTLQHMPELKDLYYLKSICEDGERRGTPFGKVFWGSIKPLV